MRYWGLYNVLFTGMWRIKQVRIKWWINKKTVSGTRECASIITSVYLYSLLRNGPPSLNARVPGLREWKLVAEGFLVWQPQSVGIRLVR